MAYPVIRLTFLLKNCQEMEKVVAQAIKGIRMAAYKKCMQDWSDYGCSMKAIHKSSDRVHTLTKRGFNELQQSMGLLMQYREQYMYKKACGKWCDEDECKYAKIVEEMRRRDELFMKLIVTCRLINYMCRKVKKMTCAINDACDFVSNNYKGLNDMS